MKKIISLSVLILFFAACQKEDVKEIIDNTPKENSLMNQVSEVKILIHEGHLHGEKLHNNPAGKLLKRKYTVFFKKQEDGKWIQELKGNPDELDLSKKGIPMLGGNTAEDFKKHNGPRYSFDMTFYNEKGEELNPKISEDENYYQVFFTSDSYHDLYDKNKHMKTIDNGKKLINYVYRDKANNENLKSELGLKGYMGATNIGISYDINISLFEWNKPSVKSKEFSFYDLPKSEGNIIAEIEIPVDVIYYLPAGRKEAEKYEENMAKYFGVTKEEFKESEEDKGSTESGNYYL